MNERIKEIVARVLEIETSSITDETSPKMVSKWDSLKHIQLMMALEQTFNIEFTPEEISNLSSFKQLKKAILEKS